jgi:hypothetical protein
VTKWLRPQGRSAQDGIFFQRATPVGVARFLLISFSC